MNGTDISACNVTNITSVGFWILIDNQEYFVPFAEYPFFKNATINDILNLKMISPKQLFWEKLDCDIELDALQNPESFPLLFK
ncbi:MAG: DUF2442 domain-containing protein [Bacteroidota bacterium]|nr:DUF2442 domain-containing protein [Bacteroidota bacterium]